jgi:hypothetical protein
MKTCGDCGAGMRYCLCLSCGWMDPEAKKRDEELKLEIEKQNSQRPHRVEVKTIRVDWSKLGARRVLSER